MADKHITPAFYLEGDFIDKDGRSHHVAVFLNKTDGWSGPLYEWLVLELDGNGWNEKARIAGPDDVAGWQVKLDTAQPAPGLGNYIHQHRSEVNDVLRKAFDKTLVPPLSNATPFSPEAFNLTLQTFFKIETDPTGNYPMMVPK